MSSPVAEPISLGHCFGSFFSREQPVKAKVLTLVLVSSTLTACGGPDSSNQANEANVAEPAAAEATNSTAANAAESVRTRQQHYEEIGKAMKGISGELRKDAPDVAAIQVHAATINRLAPQIEGWFPDGSGAEAGVKTEARAEIWSKPQEFRQATERLVTEAGRFNAAAASGDIAAIRDGVKALGGACKNCHDQFREEHD
jgi:cytochrome c556